MNIPKIDARLARDQLDLKSQDLMRGILTSTEGDLGEAVRRLAAALAWLTSPKKEHRDQAKSRVREWVKVGSVSQAKR